jgi:Tol biopolymer transport system component
VEAPSRSSRSLLANSGPTVQGRCLLLICLIVVAVLVPGSAVAAAPEGPRLVASVFHVYPNAGTEVKSVGPLGEAPLRVAGGPDSSVPGPLTRSRPAWSPDGDLLAFTGPAHGTAGLYVVGADGSDLHLVRSSRAVLFQGDPVFTPDGRSLVVTTIQVVRGQFDRPARRDPSEQKLDVRFALWAVGIDGSKPRPVTPWQRRAMLTPASFSPDGKTLVATAYDGRGVRIVAIPVGDGLRRGMRLLVKDAAEPALSPDGSRLAFVHDRRGADDEIGEGRVRRSDLLSVPFSGGTPRIVASARGGLRWPTWDPSGQRLAFTRVSGTAPAIGAEPQQGNSVMQVNADGSCLSRVFSTMRGVIYGTAWQPGPGRGAGPIVC